MFVLEVRRLEGTGNSYSMYHFGIYFSILVFNPYICKYRHLLIKDKKYKENGKEITKRKECRGNPMGISK